MLETSRNAPFALALLAATCLTPVAPAQAAPGDPIGPEFQVNTTTVGDQREPSVAMAANGDFVTAWHTCYYVDPADPFTWFCDLRTQRYNAAGEPQGGELEVASMAYGWSDDSIAMDADGNFVVAWKSKASGSSLARSYNAAGEPRGPDILVSPRNPEQLSVAMDADGDFVVVWGRSEDMFNYDVFARRYNAAGEPQGSEFLVNTTMAGEQRWPSVAMDADGDFVIAWTSRSGQDGDRSGVFAQRFDGASNPVGGEFRVNTATIGIQRDPSVAMDNDGDFVVAWESLGQDGSSYGVFAQRFDSAGEPQGGEIRVNTTTTDVQWMASVAMDADGDFVVAWAGVGSGDAGIFAQRYDATGERQGGEVQVNTFTTSAQRHPAVAMDADGDFIVVWDDDFAGLDGHDIFAQRFDGAERVEGDFDGDGKADLLWRNSATGQTVVWLMDGETKRVAGSIGTVPLEWQIAGTGDFNGDGKADVLWRNSATGNAIVWQMNGLEKAAAQSIGTVPLAWTVEQLRDTDGDGLSNIVWRNETTGATVVWRMSGFTRTAAEAIGSVSSDWRLR